VLDGCAGGRHRGTWSGKRLVPVGPDGAAGSLLFAEQARLSQALTRVKVGDAHSQRFHAIHALRAGIRVDTPGGL